MFRPILLTLTALAAAAALAQPSAGPNGGEVRFVDGYRLELVLRPAGLGVRENPLVLHVASAEGEPVQTRGAIGRATVAGGDLRGVATLHPDGGSALKGFVLYSARQDLAVSVVIRLPGRDQAIEASFRPFEQTLTPAR